MAFVVAAGALSCIIAAPVYLIYKPPTVLIRYFQYRWPDVLWHVPTSKKIIALTIDDTPSEHTEGILETLRENNVTATFFVIGSQVSGREKVLGDLVRHGNELANHAMHDEPSRSLSDGNLAQQIMTVQTQIAAAYHAVNITQPEQRFFRPGSGFFSTRMRALLGRLDYRLVLGNIFPFDPQIPYWRLNANHILSMAQSGGIIICHDRRSWTLPMLQKVLPELKKKGYHVTTVTGLLNEVKGE